MSYTPSHPVWYRFGQFCGVIIGAFLICLTFLVILTIGALSVAGLLWSIERIQEALT